MEVRGIEPRSLRLRCRSLRVCKLASSLSRHPWPLVEAYHPHAGRWCAPGLGSSPRPDDGLIHRYASAPPRPFPRWGRHRLPVPFDDGPSCPHAARGFQGVRLIVRRAALHPGQRRGASTPEPRSPRTVRTLIVRSGIRKKRGILNQTPRFSPTEQVKLLVVPPPLARTRACTPGPTTASLQTRLG